MDMGAMGLMMLIGVLIGALIIGVAIHLAIRGALHRGDRSAEPLEILQRRLAAGELTADDYFERESALRQAQPARRRR